MYPFADAIMHARIMKQELIKFAGNCGTDCDTLPDSSVGLIGGHEALSPSQFKYSSQDKELLRS